MSTETLRLLVRVRTCQACGFEWLARTGIHRCSRCLLHLTQEQAEHSRQLAAQWRMEARGPNPDEEPPVARGSSTAATRRIPATIALEEKVIASLCARSQWVSTPRLAQSLGHKYDAVRYVLQGLHAQGLVERTGTQRRYCWRAARGEQ